MISPRRLYVSADGDVVEDGDPEAQFLLVGAGCEISAPLARQYRLEDVIEDKQIRGPEQNKGRRQR